MDQIPFNPTEFLREARATLASPGRAVELQDVTSALWSVVHYLEAQKSSETPGSENSSAPTTGPVEKRLPSLGANPDTLPLRGALTELITDFFRSTPFIEPKSEVICLDSSTLQLTLKWPTRSGEIWDGGRGPVALDPNPVLTRIWDNDEDSIYDVKTVNDPPLSSSPGTSAPAAGGGSEEWYPRYIIDCLEKCHDHTDSITGHLTLNSAISWMKAHYPAAALPSSSPSTSAVGGESEG